MPSRKSAPRVPSYRRHKPSGQAVVTLNGRDIYLSKWGTKASKAEYERLIGEWLAGGRTLPSAVSSLTVAELALAYWGLPRATTARTASPPALWNASRRPCGLCARATVNSPSTGSARLP